MCGLPYRPWYKASKFDRNVTCEACLAKRAKHKRLAKLRAVAMGLRP